MVKTLIAGKKFRITTPTQKKKLSTINKCKIQIAAIGDNIVPILHR